MSRSWTIGRQTGCDVVVNHPSISDYHCRLSLTDDAFFLEDLGSGSGTFVNGRAISSKSKVTRADRILLANTVPMPWPAEAIWPGSRFLTIGRLADNDLVVDLAVVSGHHARVIWEPLTREAFIEDLGSSNGTFLGSKGRVFAQAELKAGDTVLLGTHPIPALEILARFDTSTLPRHTFADREMIIGRDPKCDLMIDVLAVSSRHARVSKVGGAIVIEDLGSSNGTFLNGRQINQPTPVVAGDVVTLGNYSFLVDGKRTPATTQPIRVNTFPVPTPPPLSPVANTASLIPPMPPTPRITTPNPPAAISRRSANVPVLVGAGCIAILAVSGSIAAVVLMGRGGGPSQPESTLLVKAAPIASPIAPEVRPTSTPIAPSDSGTREPLPKSIADAVPRNDILVSKSVPKAPKKEAAKPAKAERTLTPPPLVELEAPTPYQPSKETIAWANALDLAKISVEDEQRLGNELHALIMGQTARPKGGARFDDSEAFLKRVEEAAAPFLEARSRKELSYKFTILDSDAVNAFSMPGGFIYVCRGLFTLIGEDEPAALEFVIGHEIAHVDLKHTFACIAEGNAESKKKSVDTLQQCFLPVAFAYPDRMEFEADAWAWTQMTKTMDRSRYEALTFIRRFEGFARENKFPTDGHGQPEPGTNILDNHFRAHVAARERKKRADKVLGSSPGSSTAR